MTDFWIQFLPMTDFWLLTLKIDRVHPFIVGKFCKVWSKYNQRFPLYHVGFWCYEDFMSLNLSVILRLGKQEIPNLSNQKWQDQGSNPETLALQAESLTTPLLPLPSLYVHNVIFSIMTLTFDLKPIGFILSSYERLVLSLIKIHLSVWSLLLSTRLYPYWPTSS